MAFAPLARRDGLVVEADADGALVYDRSTDQAHWLDRDAAAVWGGCDGYRDTEKLAKACGLSPLVVEDVLERLAALDLLARPAAAPTIDRRALLGGIAKTTLALTGITTILAPTSAMAGSAFGPCPDYGRACSGFGRTQAEAQASADHQCSSGCRGCAATCTETFGSWFCSGRGLLLGAGGGGCGVFGP